MSWRHAFRDFFRRRRVAAHVRRHGDRFPYHGLDVSISETAAGAATSLGVRNALLRGKYERDEAAMILAHLPPDLPVIELGGSLGVISRLIRSRLAPGTKHLIVEANADLMAACAENAIRGAAPGETILVNAAVWHDGPVARFMIGDLVHSNAVDTGGGSGTVREVPAVTLSALIEKIGNPPRYALVSDIEGGEWGIFEHEAGALSGAEIAILEIHPRQYLDSGRSEAEFMELARRAGFSEIDRQQDVVVLKRG